MAKTAKEFQPLSVVVLTVSSRHTPATDSSGDLICHLLQQAGHQLSHRAIVASDKYQIRAEVSRLLCENQHQVILLNGGTGFSADNCTVAAISALFDQQVPGFGELFRQLSFSDIGSAALQSNAVAGLANHKLLVAMPGSPSACELAMQQLVLPQLDARQGPCNFAPLLLQPVKADGSAPLDETRLCCPR
ncbi:molybdenum cofactor synthesis domain-containing protein [Rheinheimera sp.]|uniref:molybdenum cofactor synthesis domain-containing protein n=1 Tax=Rheinheimera sp. TaxID=1869214 RepID=UPI002FDDF0BD